MNRFTVTVVMALLSIGVFGGEAKAAATLPKEPVVEKPVSIVIPRDLLLLAKQKLDTGGCGLSSSGTAVPATRTR